MSWSRIIAQPILSTIGQYMSLPKDGHRCLMYHSIANNSRNPFTVTEDQFYFQMKKLLEEKISICEFSNNCHVQANSFSISISFDDGYLDNLRYAAPILMELKFPFTVFVVSDFVRTNKKEYLQEFDLRELSILPGVAIGVHGKTHRPLTKMPFEEAKQELLDSKKYLEDIIGKSVHTMSFPHGAYNQEIIQTCQQVGFGKAGTSDLTLNRKNQFLVARTVIMQGDSILDFMAKVKGAWDFHYKLRGHREESF